MLQYQPDLSQNCLEICQKTTKYIEIVNLNKISYNYLLKYMKLLEKLIDYNIAYIRQILDKLSHTPHNIKTLEDSCSYIWKQANKLLCKLD